MDDRFYTKECTCSACQHRYRALRLRQRACIPVRRDTDFNVVYQDLSCLFYEVLVCPACGYAETGSMAAPSVAARKVYQVDVAPKWQTRDLNGVRDAKDAVSCLKLALFCSQIRSDRSSVMAALALRLAWIYRGLDEREQEERFLTMALKDYEAAYSKEDLREDGKEITFAYLIGELYRRLDQRDIALRWFNVAISHPAAQTKPQVIKMAREQWRLVRDQQKESAQAKM